MTIKLSQTPARIYSPKLVEELGIHVIPMSFNFGMKVIPIIQMSVSILQRLF